MNFLDALSTSASGLSAQRLRMNLISNNLANINTTKTEEGGPYQRKDAVFAAVSSVSSVSGAGDSEFGKELSRQLSPGLTEVQVASIQSDHRPPVLKYDPEHPDADESGYVSMPNINVVEEMVNMISASRSYEANITAIGSTKEMVNQALEIGR